MNFKYVTIDGQRVEERVAVKFEEMAAAFKKQFGLDLLVTSGTRTHAEQQRLFDQKKTIARPGQSNHNEDGPLGGPRALDLRDSGSDAGVTRIGSARSNWLKKNCHRWGFALTGATFRPPEGWHYEYILPFDAPAAPPAVTPPSTTVGSTGNKFGLDDVRGLQKVSAMYANPARRTEPDNHWGPWSEEGFDNFLRKFYGGTGDKALAAWLRKRWGYVGNDVYGPNMKAALARANEANFKEL